jgi:hypothetical protein
MWLDLILIFAALIPLFFTRPIRMQNLPPAAE